METKIKIAGMSCSHCSARVKKALEGTNGVTNAEVDLANGAALVSHSELVTAAMLKDVIEELGFDATV